MNVWGRSATHVAELEGGSRPDVSGGDLPIANGAKHAIDDKAILGERQQDRPVQYLYLFVNSPSRLNDRLFQLFHFSDLFCRQLQQGSHWTLTDPLPLQYGRSGLLQRSPDVRKTRIRYAVAKIDDEAEIPVIAEFGPVYVAASWVGRPAPTAPCFFYPCSQPTFQIIV